MLALHLRGDAFSDEDKARAFDYYERRTVRDSSLAASTHAVIAAEVGHVELAYDYLGEAALVDLHNLHSNASNGLHMASLTGAWIAVVAGLGGMRDHGGRLSFAPRLPRDLRRLAFRLCFRGRRLAVEVNPEQAGYTLLSGEPVELTHHGEPLTARQDETARMPIPPAPELEPPEQPRGRRPRAREGRAGERG